jgi:hypothetical protein
MLGGLYDVRVTGEETNGAATVIEFTVPPGAGPPPHVHDQDEILHVIEGNVRIHIGDKTVEAGPGTVVFIPKGTLETFEPISTVRILGIYTPGGIDRFFIEASEPAERREVPPPLTSPPDVARLASIGAKYGLELKPPPDN